MAEKIMDQRKIHEFLRGIDENLTGPVSMIMIGGGAMSLRGEKEATKDIDVVLTKRAEFDLLCLAMEKMNFNTIVRFTNLDPAYQRMDARIYKDDRGYWMDIFLERICQKFLIGNDIISRSEKILEFENLEVSLMSREDIFITKSITERVGDLDDMYVLYMTELDAGVIITELDHQSKNNPQIWESFMFVKLEELEQRFDFTIPWKNKVMHVAEEKMEELIKGKNMNP